MATCNKLTARNILPKLDAVFLVW